MRYQRARKHSRFYKPRIPTGLRPAGDILPRAERPLFDRPMLAHNPAATACRHGVPFEVGFWCDKCDRHELTRWVDAGLDTWKRKP